MRVIAGSADAGLPDGEDQFYALAHKLGFEAPGRARMYENFAANIEAICGSGVAAGASVVLCTVGNNLRDMPPYYSLHRPGLTEARRREWEEHYEAGIDAGEGTTDWTSAALDAARHHFEQAAAIDPYHADTQFRLGRSYLRATAYDQAREAFTIARDTDAFPVRADTRINREIRRIAAAWTERGVLMVDMEEAFASASPDGIVGNDFFYDVVHLHVEGAHLIASSVFDAAASKIASKTGTAPVSAGLSLEACKRHLGLSPYLEARYLRDAFEELKRSQAFHPRIEVEALRERLARLEHSLDDAARDTALAALTQALAAWEDDFHIRRLLIELLSESGRADEARLQAREMLARFPHWPAARRLYQRFQ